MMKFNTTFLTFIFLFSCSTAFATEEYVCNKGDEKRIISINYESNGSSVPCEVEYEKGESTQTLWSAQTESGYCEKRVDELIDKQESWGWSCEKTGHDAYAEDLVSDLY